ncbi:MAG: PIN domain-containing protein [Coriobacteriales bacterium]
MTYLILDTNVLVSALWRKLDEGKPALILRRCLDRHYKLVYTAAMLDEYEAVLRRPKFKFDEDLIAQLLESIGNIGLCADPVSRGLTWPLCVDGDDQGFFDAALDWDAILVTGNKKHYPVNDRVLTPTEFLEGRT